MRKIVLFTIILLASGLNAQGNKNALEYASLITVEELKYDLSIIASDAMEGRNTGERGQKMAATFIASSMEAMGLEAPYPDQENPYYQYMTLYRTTPPVVSMSSGNKRYTQGVDFVVFSAFQTGEPLIVDVIFGGEGDSITLANLTITDKVVLLRPRSIDEWREAWQNANTFDPSMILISPFMDEEEFTKELKGSSNRSGRLELQKPQEMKEKEIGFAFISPKMAQSIFKWSNKDFEKKIRSLKRAKYAEDIRTMTLNMNWKIEEVLTENVLGYIKGETKPEEVIILTAHYDHLGKNGDNIYNGADDDGSGTIGILEMAEAFAQAKKDGNGPARTIVFMLVTGEERGLLGSGYYAQNPLFPLEHTITNLNIDMIGRIDEEHKQDTNYIYLVGSDKISMELHNLSESINSSHTGFNLDYTYNDEDHPMRIYYRSDHWNFAKNGIPVIFYFSGLHDDYHKPTDTVEKIRYELLKPGIVIRD